MAKKLPARPNLDHLRRQAKALLTALDARDPAAVATIREHLPLAQKLTAAQILAAKFRLADAQSAVARSTGFAGWPHLARHVEQLRALEGTWNFARLEVDGHAMPAGMFTTSRVLIDGDRFRTESPDATYEGIFNVNVEADPHELDIEFIAGPEAGKWNYAIFRLTGDQLDLCLDLNGRPRPKKFGTSAGSGHACETLTRASASRPADVKGGTAPAPPPPSPAVDASGFDYVPSPLLTQLQGQWSAVKLIRDGMELPAMMLRTGLRAAAKNEVKISFGGQTVIDARIRFDADADPVHVDYLNVGGMAPGTIQLGLMKWDGDEACFCMGAPGQPRPDDFSCAPGSGRTLSQWRRKK